MCARRFCVDKIDLKLIVNGSVSSYCRIIKAHFGCGEHLQENLRFRLEAESGTCGRINRR
jgi:hypothetical protein